MAHGRAQFNPCAGIVAKADHRALQLRQLRILDNCSSLLTQLKRVESMAYQP
jgi:hypothetical protein